jgi:RNA polymerase sigma-70 factor (ECF subfamily)
LTEIAYKDAVRRNGQRIYLIALSFLRSPEDAEDVMQNVFLKLWQRRIGFADETHMDKWLTRVTVNECRSLFRSQRGELPLEAVEGVLHAPSLEPEQDLVRAVMSLPESLRTVIHLFYYEELSVKEIASLLHLSQGAVKTRLSRGREKLKESLQEEQSNE